MRLQVDPKAPRPALVSPLGGAHRIISAILCAVRNSVFSITLLLFLAQAVFVLAAPTVQSFQEGQPQPPPPQEQPSVPAPPGALAPAPPPAGPLIVLDPAHGGTDSGARGEGGLAEKDIVLQIARTVRAQLERQGYRVLMTRSDDSNPSYDDRAALANAHRDVIFISLHVASTGVPGTVRAYYEQMSSAAIEPSATTTPRSRSFPRRPSNTLIVWEQAQRPYLEASHHLADLIQLQLAQSFSASPVTSTAAAVRTLRSIMGPAVAIEISSISGSSRDVLTGSGGPLSAAIARGISALRPSSAEVK